jgi:hypothetical protein
MIKYRLVCGSDHEFEGWFGDSGAFDSQAAAGLLICPACGSSRVTKAMMAPAVATRSNRANPIAPSSSQQNAAGESGCPAMTKIPVQAVELVRQLRDEIRKNTEYVGTRFAEEARRIHYKEAPERGIYGEASGRDVAELAEEGVDIFPLPALPEDQN